MINVISTQHGCLVVFSPEHSEQLCRKYFYWFQRYDVTEGRGGGMQESWSRQHAATRHPGMCITGPGHVEGQLGQLGQRVGTSESMSAHNQSWPLAPGQQGTWSHTGHYRYLAMCVSPTISDNLYMNCRKNHWSSADAIS